MLLDAALDRPIVPAPPDRHDCRRLVSWAFNGLAVPPTFRPGARIRWQLADQADASALVDLRPASRPNRRLSLHTAEATGSKPVTPTRATPPGNLPRRLLPADCQQTTNSGRRSAQSVVPFRVLRVPRPLENGPCQRRVRWDSKPRPCGAQEAVILTAKALRPAVASHPS